MSALPFLRELARPTESVSQSTDPATPSVAASPMQIRTLTHPPATPSSRAGLLRHPRSAFALHFCRDRKERNWQFQRTLLDAVVALVPVVAQAGCGDERRGLPSVAEPHSGPFLGSPRSDDQGTFARARQEVPPRANLPKLRLTHAISWDRS